MRSQFTEINGTGDFLFCNICNIAIPVKYLNNGTIDRNGPINHSACENHLKSATHQDNLLLPEPKKYGKLRGNMDEIMGYDEKAIVFVEGVTAADRLFCMACCTSLHTSYSKIKIHCSTNKHLRNVGLAFTTIDEILEKNKEFVKRNQESPHIIDCLVCVKSINAGVQILTDHLKCKRHLGILKESNESSDPSDPSDKFAVQRERHKTAFMRGCVKQYPVLQVKLDEENIHRFHCAICQKFLIGQSQLAANRHLNSPNHKKNERDAETGETLDEFLYRFFKVICEGL